MSTGMSNSCPTDTDQSQTLIGRIFRFEILHESRRGEKVLRMKKASKNSQDVQTVPLLDCKLLLPLSDGFRLKSLNSRSVMVFMFGRHATPLAKGVQHTGAENIAIN